MVVKGMDSAPLRMLDAKDDGKLEHPLLHAVVERGLCVVQTSITPRKG